MTAMKKLWIALTLVLVGSFAVLGWIGVEVYHKAPPVPDRIVTESGEVLVDSGGVYDGQNVWQSMGGMQVGSIWGHGSYVAPDWTADWLHRESLFILGRWSQERFGKPWEQLAVPQQAELQAELQKLIRRNDYDPTTKTLTIPDIRADAFRSNRDHLADVFQNGREDYAIPANAVTDPASIDGLSAFVFWTSWAAATNRPGTDISYTSNWPHEPLVGNVPTGSTVVWTGVSVIMLLLGIGGLALYHAMRQKEEPHGEIPARDPLLGTRPTGSQLAVVKYFWVVGAMLLVQILLGVVVAHYGVEGTAFYGIPLAEWLPYSVARTWHLQLGIFWIATAWLGAGLYIAPAVGGRDPKGQKLGVNVLFVALVLVVVGSLAGQWLSVKQKLGSGSLWFYFGHSGYEYIDLGRAWQIGLLVGLFLWLFLVVRAVWPAMKRKDEQRPVLGLFVLSSAAIAGMYGAALGYGQRTNLAIAEYWRWWVVHLWVEGFFEVFATVVIAFLFARLKLVSLRTAGEASILSATIFLAGGIIGTAHHLYFSGTPTSVLALGSVFSALEVVPLLFVGFEAWHNLKLCRRTEWIRMYRWPIYFFVAVAFWNLVGAGLFGFMINPPIALYYMQGLNTTPVHGHAALFGVYGMLGIGLMLFVLRALAPELKWREKLVAFSFWAINIGLMAMILLSLLPVGLAQTWASVETGYWYARSPEFLQTPVMDFLRWMRVPGDTIFAIGALVLVAFMVGLGVHRPTREARRSERERVKSRLVTGPTGPLPVRKGTT